MLSSGYVNKINISSNLTRSCRVWVWPRHVLAGKLGWLAAVKGCHRGDHLRGHHGGLSLVFLPLNVAIKMQAAFSSFISFVRQSKAVRLSSPWFVCRTASALASIVRWGCAWSPIPSVLYCWQNILIPCGFLLQTIPGLCHLPKAASRFECLTKISKNLSVWINVKTLHFGVFVSVLSSLMPCWVSPLCPP